MLPIFNMLQELKDNYLKYNNPSGNVRLIQEIDQDLTENYNPTIKNLRIAKFCLHLLVKVGVPKDEEDRIMIEIYLITLEHCIELLHNYQVEDVQSWGF